MNPTINEQLKILRPQINYGAEFGELSKDGDFLEDRDFLNATGLTKQKLFRLTQKIENTRQELGTIKEFLISGSEKPLKLWVIDKGLMFTVIPETIEDVGSYTNREDAVQIHYNNLEALHDKYEERYDKYEEEYDKAESYFDDKIKEEPSEGKKSEENKEAEEDYQNAKNKKGIIRKRRKAKKRFKRTTLRARREEKRAKRIVNRTARNKALEKAKTKREKAREAWKAAGKPGGRKGLRSKIKAINKEKRQTIEEYESFDPFKSKKPKTEKPKTEIKKGKKILGMPTGVVYVGGGLVGLGIVIGIIAIVRKAMQKKQEQK